MTVEDVKRVYNEHAGFYNKVLLDKEFDDLNVDGTEWLLELLEAVEAMVLEPKVIDRPDRIGKHRK